MRDTKLSVPVWIKWMTVMVFITFPMQLVYAQDPQQKVVPASLLAGDNLGYSVDIDGDFAVVGAISDDGLGVSAGTAYIFQRIAGIWTEIAEIQGNDTAAGDLFGYSVAISGDKVVVGARQHDPLGVSNAGAAYVFDGANGWNQAQKLVASDAEAFDLFGEDVDIYVSESGSIDIVVGAYLEDTGASEAGAAYLFSFNGGALVEQQKIQAADADLGDQFGRAVAMTRDRVIIGAYRDDGAASDAGAAYIFDRSGSVWSQTQKLQSTDPDTGDNFGIDVAIDGNRAIVGAHLDDGNAGNGGAAYLFTVADCAGTLNCVRSNWSGQRINPASFAAADYFGHNVAIDANVIAIGAYLADPGAIVNAGRVHTFTITHAGLVERTHVAADAAASDNYARGLSVAGNVVLAGARLDDDSGSSSGSVYFIDMDSDGDGMPSAFELANACCDPLVDDSASDSDGDGLLEAGEFLAATNPAVSDTDADNFDDGDEINTSSDPLLQTSLPVETRLTAFDFADTDYFGRRVAIEGDIAVVGSYFDDDLGSASGAAYVYGRSGSGWVLLQKLLASDGAFADQFGADVDISGDTIVIGALGDDDAATNAGAAYVFARQGNTWVEQQKITAVGAMSSDAFGQAVAVDGNIMVIGAYFDDSAASNAGSGHVFIKTGGVWQHRAELVPADGADNDYTGAYVDVSGSTVVLGSYLNDEEGTNAGAAYIYVNDGPGDSWVQQAKLMASDAASNDYFGYSVSLSDDTLVIGAYLDDDLGGSSGAAYVFSRAGSAWSEQQKLLASDGAVADNFGRSVILEGNNIVVGASGDDDAAVNAGAAYHFVNEAGVWSQGEKFSASDALGTDTLGFAVGLSGETIVAGAYLSDANASPNSGAAYIFELDADADGLLNPVETDSGSFLSDSDTGTDPFNPDADGDGLQDGFEVAAGFNPFVSGEQVLDADADGLDNLQEQVAGSDPLSADSDNDGFPDNIEVQAGSDPASSQSVPDMTKFLAVDGDFESFNFGQAVAADGDYAVVGSGPFSSPAVEGAAYVYQLTNNSWQFMTKLEASDGSAGNRFGSSVAIEANRIVIGAEDVEKVYIYELSAGFWNEVDQLVALDVSFKDFGSAVAIKGNTIAVGAMNDSSVGATNAGSAYVFTESGGTWTELQKVVPLDVSANAQYGSTIVLSDDGETIVVGSPGAPGVEFRAGAVYVHQFDGFFYEQQARLVASDGTANSEFGIALALDGNSSLVVGAPEADTNGFDSGSAYWFTRVETSWTQREILTSSDAKQFDQFGSSVAIDGNLIAIGAHLDFEGALSDGSVSLFLRTGGNWIDKELRPFDGTNDQRFGAAVALVGDWLWVGSRRDSDQVYRAGSAYAINLDLDDDGLSTHFEEIYGFDPFASGEQNLDFDADGVTNSEEEQTGTNPFLQDTDSDGFSDENEILVGSDPVDPLSTPLYQSVGSGSSQNISFGSHIAVGDDVLVVGARGATNSVNNEGVAYVFERDLNGAWTIVQTLESSDPANAFDFSVGVAMHGDTLAIGSSGDNTQANGAGSVEIFVRDMMGVWSSQQVIFAPDAELGDEFGTELTIENDRLVVGAYEEGVPDDSGSVYVFDRVGTTWGFTQKIVPASLSLGNQFGLKVDLSGDTLVAAARPDGIGTDGEAYVYVYNGVSWSLQQILTSPEVGTFYASSVAISGDTILVGDVVSSAVLADAGAVRVYERTGTTWTETQVFSAMNVGPGDFFGFGIEMDGGNAIVGSPFSPSGGDVYIFSYQNGSWQEQNQLVAEQGQLFGLAIDIAGDISVATSVNPETVYINIDDQDIDGVTRSNDNCPSVPNANQANGDNDDFGDVCDLDDDPVPSADAGLLDLLNLATLTGSALNVSVDLTPNQTIDYTPDVGYDGPSSLCFELNNQPTWLNLGSASGRIQGTPTNINYGSYPVTWRAVEALIPPAGQGVDCDTLLLSSGQDFTSGTITLNVLDTFAPSISSVPATGGAFQASQMVTLTCAESIGSGCASVEYVLDTSAPFDDEPSIVVAVDGNNQIQVAVATSGVLRVRSVDASGNKSAIADLAFTIDSVDPAVEISAPIQPFVTTTQVQFAGVADDVDSGIASIVLDVDDTPNGGSSNLSQISATVKTMGSCTGDAGDGASSVTIPAPCWEATYTPSSTDGSIAFTVTASDVVGNTSLVQGGFDNFSGVSQPTSLSLTNVTSNSLPFNGDVDMAYAFQVIGSSGLDLSTETVTLTITPPPGSASAATVLNVQPNNDGQLTLTGLGSSDYTLAPNFRFNEKGVWSIEADYAGSIRYQPSSSNIEDIVVGTSAGYAVLIQGQASTSNNDGLVSYNRTLNRVYDTLRRRNFDDQNIFYFNFDATQDVNGDGVPDNIFQDGKGIDADIDIVGKAGIQAQLQNLFFLMNSNPAPLYVVMVDHGRRANGGTPSASSEFLLGNATDGDTTITPVELDAWMDALESNLNSEAALEPRVVINGSCYSGGFVEPLTGVNGVAAQTAAGDPLSPRIVITSSSPDEVSYKGPLEDPLDPDSRAGEYFIESLFDALEDGVTLLDAFELATNDTEEFTRAEDNAAFNGEFLDGAVQHPLICDNNDGLGSNFIQSAQLEVVSSNVDGQFAAGIYLGNASQSATNSLLVPAAVANATATTFLPAGTALPQDSEVFITIEPNDNQETAAAFVEVRAPQTVLPGGDVGGTFPTEQLEATQLVQLGLDAPGIAGCPSIPATWCRTESTFSQPGKYEIYHYVTDSETGALSEGVRTLVYKNKGSNDFATTNEPAIFDLVSPSSGASLGGSVTILSWTPSSDVDGLSYTVRLCENEPDIDNPVNPDSCREFTEIDTAFYGVTGLRDIDEANQPVTYYWGVDAVDNFGSATKAGSATNPPRSVWNFTAQNTNAPTGLLGGYVQSKANFQFLSGANVAGGVANTVSDAAGNYLMELNQGSLTMTTSKTGFQDEVVTVFITANTISAQNFSLDEDLPDADGDGVDDSSDNCVNTSNPGQENFDGDAEGDACDSDDDNDQISDDDENSTVLDPTDLLDPLNPADALLDSDGDGLSNRDEINVHGTEIFSADTDNDGASDGNEVNAGSDPNDSNSLPVEVTVPIPAVFTVWAAVLCLLIGGWRFAGHRR